MHSRARAVLVVTAGFGVLLLLGNGPLAQFYTPQWAAGSIPLLFGPLAIVAAVLVPRSAPWSLGGYAVGVILGEVIGQRVYQGHQARLQSQLAHPAYSQDWEPSHPGWWIAALVFLTLTGVGCWLGRRASLRQDSTSGLAPAVPG